MVLENMRTVQMSMVQKLGHLYNRKIDHPLFFFTTNAEHSYVANGTTICRIDVAI